MMRAVAVPRATKTEADLHHTAFGPGRPAGGAQARVPASPGWRIVRCAGESPERRARVRDEARIEAVVRYLHAHECVALLGPPHSEKSELLQDVAAALRGAGRCWPLYVDLWQVRSDDEAAFFSSLARLISEATGAEHSLRKRGEDPLALETVPDVRAFQNYLAARVNAGQGHLALLIDHLQALPPDLVHSLLLALRAAYMERDADAPKQLVAVITGGMNLVGLSTGPTSPFNIAKPVVALPLTEEQTAALAEATFEEFGCEASKGALQRIVHWVGGDRYLVPRLCAWSADLVQGHRKMRVTAAVVERAVARLWLTSGEQPPIREAIRMIEEDPDTMLDVIHLLDQDKLPRGRSRQMITRTGTDRLQLSGAVVLIDGHYYLKNQAYRAVLASHFTTERVGHVLRIAGRWREAIEYLAPRLTADRHPLPVSSAQSAASGLQFPGPAGARPQLLEAIVQSIYATDSLERACELLADGLRIGFGLSGVSIYRANPAQGRLELVYPPVGEHSPRATVDLYGRDTFGSVEAQTFHYGSYALRGSADQARLVVALAAQSRPIGIVTVERYAENRDPHSVPGELPDLLYFLQHAAAAIENVMVRAAYRAIGQAVLSASTLQPTLGRVLEAVSEALGCDVANLYLLEAGANGGGAVLAMAAGVGRAWSAAWQAMARYPRSSSHPAAQCLREQRMAVVRGSDDRLNTAIADRFGLHKYAFVYLPLQAAGDQLGALELGYAGGLKIALTEESRRTLSAFADQVAIAVHNMQLLRRTDEALARRVDELEKLRSSSLAISSTLDLDVVLARIVYDVQALFPDIETTVWEYDAEQMELTLLQSSLDEAGHAVQRASADGIIGRAVLTHQLQAEDGPAPVPDAPDLDPAARLGLRTVVAVPLVSRDRPLGAISLCTQATTPYALGPGEAELLKAFAAQAAVAIDNARLHREEIERQRLEEELAVGRQIQISMLPKACPAVPGWEFDAVYRAARIVGGDFYDFCELPGKPPRLGVVIADVAGKGVPAALFMALSRTIIRTTALSGRGPAAALMRANELILNDSQGDMFLSAVYALLELETGRMIYANAGHGRPLLYRAATGSVSELSLRGLILGSFEDIQLGEDRLDLASGDVVLLCTDGITEALNADGELFGDERLMAVLAANGTGSAQQILRAVLDALEEFTEGAEQADDVTCVVGKRV